MPGVSAALIELHGETIKTLAADGIARNEIARQLGISNTAVTLIAKAVGAKFDRAKTAASTEARRIDLKARRTELSIRFLDEAHLTLDQLHAPHVAFSFGGKDNVYTEHAMDRPPVDAQERIMRTAGTALLRHIDIEKHDSDAGADAARSMLADLGRALGVKPVDG